MLPGNKRRRHLGLSDNLVCNNYKKKKYLPKIIFKATYFETLRTIFHKK